MLKSAFIYLAGGFEGRTEPSVSKTPNVEITTIGASSYAEAVAIAKEFCEEGYACLELCGGFGHQGAAMVVAAIEGKIPVGVSRFDYRPGGKLSGDTVYLA